MLLITGRTTPKVYVAYTTFYALGTLLAMTVYFINFQAVQSSEHMAALGVFGLLQLVYGLKWVRSLLSEAQFNYIVRFAITVAVAVGSVAVAIGLATGCTCFILAFLFSFDFFFFFVDLGLSFPPLFPSCVYLSHHMGFLLCRRHLPLHGSLLHTAGPDLCQGPHPHYRVCL